MRIKAVLDTNVLVSGLCRIENSVTYKIIATMGKAWELCITPGIYLEYKSVLTRPNIKELTKLSSKEVEDVLNYIADISEKHLIYYTWRPNLIDESDNKFVECAVVSNADYIITGNRKHFKNTELGPFQFKVIPPKQFSELIVR